MRRVGTRTTTASDSLGLGERVSVNVICVAGVVIGLIAMMLPWASDSGINVITDQTFSKDFYLNSESPLFDDNIIFQSLSYLFLAGTFLGIITPLAFYVQICGLTAFGFIWDHYSGGIHDFTIDQHQLEIGFYIGVASAIVIIVSYLKPYVIGSVDMPSGVSRWKRLTLRAVPKSRHTWLYER